jgi:hypothetical protein
METAEQHFPSSQQIRSIVDCARWAPTGDNVQQFFYEWNGRELFVREDADRSRAFLNVGNAASHLALGMCLCNIEIGAKGEGWETHWTFVGKGDVLARVTFVPGPVEHSSWEKAVRLRAVDRRPYRSDPIPVEMERALEHVVQNAWGIRFCLVKDPAPLHEMARINGNFDSFMFEHKGIHSYFYRWLRQTDEEALGTGDGMPLSTLGVNAVDAISLRLVANWGIARLFSFLGFTRMAVLRARRIYRHSAAFGIFSMPSPDPLSFVRAGWLWQRVWLKLTENGWSLQPVMGLSLMGLLCRLRGGEGLSVKQKERFTKEEMEMRRCLSVGEGETVACVFRLGRPETPVTSRALRRPLDTLLKIQK